jgi:hypothetical protein
MQKKAWSETPKRLSHFTGLLGTGTALAAPGQGINTGLTTFGFHNRQRIALSAEQLPNFRRIQ